MLSDSEGQTAVGQLSAPACTWAPSAVPVSTSNLPWAPWLWPSQTHRCTYGPSPHVENVWPLSRLSICASKPMSHVKTLILHVVASGGGAFGKWLGYESRVPMKGSGTFMKETPESPLAPSAIWGHSEKAAVCRPGRGPSPDPKSVGTLI